MLLRCPSERCACRQQTNGGLRASLVMTPSGSEDEGEVTIAELFDVHPFGNALVTQTMTGAQIESALENQFTSEQGILQVSGLRYSYATVAADGARVEPADVFVGDEPPRRSSRGSRRTLRYPRPPRRASTCSEELSTCAHSAGRGSRPRVVCAHAKRAPGMTRSSSGTSSDTTHSDHNRPLVRYITNWTQ
jgi:hypothetical protein